MLCLSHAQTICDCVKLYLEKVINILESNGYYDYIDNQEFDVTDQVVIAVCFEIDILVSIMLESLLILGELLH